MLRNHVLDDSNHRNDHNDQYGGGYADNSGHGFSNHSTPSNMTNDPWYNNPSPSGSPSKEQDYKDSVSQQIHRFSPNAMGYSAEDDDYDNEPPLLEELGIRVDHIWSKTQAVIHPTKEVGEHILDDSDLAGPLLFCLLLGALCLLAGKIHFGYIYGFGIFGCMFMHTVINLLDERGLDIWLTCSALGYCLLPVLVLAAINVVFSLKGVLGLLLSLIAIAWCTITSTRLFDARLHLKQSGQYWLVAYPAALLYGCFVMITVL